MDGGGRIPLLCFSLRFFRMASISRGFRIHFSSHDTPDPRTRTSQFQSNDFSQLNTHRNQNHYIPHRLKLCTTRITHRGGSSHLSMHVRLMLMATLGSTGESRKTDEGNSEGSFYKTRQKEKGRKARMGEGSSRSTRECLPLIHLHLLHRHAGSWSQRGRS